MQTFLPVISQAGSIQSNKTQLFSYNSSKAESKLVAAQLPPHLALSYTDVYSVHLYEAEKASNGLCKKTAKSTRIKHK